MDNIGYVIIGQSPGRHTERVGPDCTYANRTDAEKVQELIQEDYPGYTFVVVSVIVVPTVVINQ